MDSLSLLYITKDIAKSPIIRKAMRESKELRKREDKDSDELRLQRLEYIETILDEVYEKIK